MKITEENFIVELKKKNEKALEYLIDNYGWIIKTVASKHLVQFPHLIDECMNDVLMDIWNNSHRFDEKKGSIKNFIAGVSKFKSIDYKRKYMKDLYNKDISDMNIEVKDTMLESELKVELSDETEGMLACLKKDDRELFMKLYVEDKKVEEVAKETGMSRNVIYNRLSRSRKKLKSLFVARV